LQSNTYRHAATDNGAGHLTANRKQTVCDMDVTGQLRSVSQTLEGITCPFCIRDADRVPVEIRRMALAATRYTAPV